MTNAMNTNMGKPALNAAMNIKNFEKNPANGGIPAKEKRQRVMMKDNFGLVS